VTAMRNNYNYSEHGQDEYCYPKSIVLINSFGLKDYDSLAAVERDITFVKSVELEKNPIRGRYDFAHLRAIHRYLFCDIYEWAGEIRRGEFLIKGDTIFCRGQFITQYAENIFEKLKNENKLRNLKREEFIQRLAYYMGEINALHPFREGNGRSARAFFMALSRSAGYELNFNVVSPELLLDADIEAFDKNFDPLISILESIICKKKRHGAMDD